METAEIQTGDQRVELRLAAAEALTPRRTSLESHAAGLPQFLAVIAQFGLIVHFAPAATQNDSVQINGRTVYSLPKDTLKHYVKSDLTWSPGSQHLAFIERYEDTQKNTLIILAEGEKELAWELPAEMNKVRDIEWLDEQTLLLRQFNLTYLEGPMWKFGWTKQQLALLDIETKKSLVTGLLKESAAREHLIQSLGGGDPDWWFVK